MRPFSSLNTRLGGDKGWVKNSFERCSRGKQYDTMLGSSAELDEGGRSYILPVQHPGDEVVSDALHFVAAHSLFVQALGLGENRAHGIDT